MKVKKGTIIVINNSVFEVVKLEATYCSCMSIGNGSTDKGKGTFVGIPYPDLEDASIYWLQKGDLLRAKDRKGAVVIVSVHKVANGPKGIEILVKDTPIGVPSKKESWVEFDKFSTFELL